MSVSNVELVHLGVDAVNHRDLATLDAMWSEEGEFHSTFAASEGRVFRGRQRFRDYFDTVDEAFDDMRVEVEEINEVGEDRLVVVLRVSGRGKGSGVNVEQHNGQVWTFVDSKIARIDSYMNRAEALEAAGLSEQDAHADS
jgi:ketosteroid isomerase-like protein